MEEYADALAEVDVILGHLDDNDYNKIPKEMIEIINKYKNKNYIFNYDDSLELKDQKLLYETRAFLYNLFRDYLATPEQSLKVKEWQREERTKLEIQKQEKYKYKELFTNKEKKEVKEETKEIVEYRTSIFERFIKKIKKIFKKEK